MKKTVEQILKEIGCVTEVKNVKEFVFDHTDFGGSGMYEEYFKIYAEEGTVIGRIKKLDDGTVKRKFDYVSNLKFSKNVNTWEDLR